MALSNLSKENGTSEEVFICNHSLPNTDSDQVNNAALSWAAILAWSLAALASAIMIASAIDTVVTSSLRAATALSGAATVATVASSITAAGNEISQTNDASRSKTGAMGYIIDALFRKGANVPNTSATEQITSPDNMQQPHASEVKRIFVHAMHTIAMPPGDLSYPSQLVSKHTGLTKPEPESYMEEMYPSLQKEARDAERDAEIVAKDAVDTGRKASIYSTLWLFSSLLMATFSVSLAATWCGRRIDA